MSRATAHNYPNRRRTVFGQELVRNLVRTSCWAASRCRLQVLRQYIEHAVLHVGGDV